jgi:hypothetical protein
MHVDPSSLFFFAMLDAQFAGIPQRLAFSCEAPKERSD